MKSGKLVGSTTLLANFDDQVMMVDVTEDLRKVVVTSPFHREEGLPESARAFARKLRREHGQLVEEFCAAIERAADKCISKEDRRPS